MSTNVSRAMSVTYLILALDVAQFPQRLHEESLSARERELVLVR